MSRALVAGHVSSGPRRGDVWVGVQGDNHAYDRVVGLAGSPFTDVLVIGGVDECLALIRVMAETLLAEGQGVPVLAGMERIIEELDVIEDEMEAEDGQ